MTGMELSRRFFFEEGLPCLKEQFPSIAARCAAGLISGRLPSGCGSEVMGFDDTHSHDHNYGPRIYDLCCILLLEMETGDRLRFLKRSKTGVTRGLQKR